MANTKLNILEHSKQLLVVAALVLAGFVLLHAPRAHAASGACPTPTTDMGSVTSTISVTTSGTYRAWSRIMSGTASTDNSYSLEIDGSSCYVVGDNNSMATGSWQWVNYQNGTTSSTIDVALTAGSHTIKMIGREDGVKLDRVGFTTDTSCTPTGTGDNCFPPIDTTPPTASFQAPTQGAHVKGIVSVVVPNSDNSGIVSKLELYVDGSNPCTGTPGTLVTTMNNPPATATLSWNTSGLSNAGHAIWVKAYDPSGNTFCTADLVTVDNSPPTVTLPVPANGATLSGTVSLTANAGDNVGVVSVSFFDGTSQIASMTTPTSGTTTNGTYTYSWNTSAVSTGSHTLTAKATDAAGNVTTSTAVNVTVNGGSGDNEKPVTSITDPVSGSTLLYGPNIISVSASDNVGVTKVELYIDGSSTPAATDVAAPYSFSVDATTLSSGNHTLLTKAYDAAGNVGVSSSITVIVNSNYANPGDVTGDGHVTILDLSTILTNYGLSGFKSRAQGDLDGNGTVNVLDLSTCLSHYGT